MKNLFKIIWGIGSAIYYGYVFGIVWNGFMPHIFGLPTLSIPQALGVSMVMAMPFYGWWAQVYMWAQNDGKETPFYASAMATSAIWFFAYIYQLFL